MYTCTVFIEVPPHLGMADVGVGWEGVGGQADGLAVVLQGLSQAVLLVDLVAQIPQLLRLLPILRHTEIILY